MKKKQDKQRELDMFDVRHEDGYDLQSEAFYQFVEDRLNRHAPSAMTGKHRVLEAGCGTGAFARHFLKALAGKTVWEVTGVDLAPAMVEWNRLHPAPGFNSMVGDLENETLFAPASFDIILCPMVLHHFPDPVKTITNLAAWLKPGGVFYIMEPNGSSPVNRFSKFIRHCIEKIMGLEYARRFATVNETDHPMKLYLRELTSRGCVVCHHETRSIYSANDCKTWIGRIRFVLHKIASLLPQPYCGNTLLVIARKG